MKVQIILIATLLSAFAGSVHTESRPRTVRYGDNGPATKAVINGPTAVAVHGTSTLYIAEAFGDVIRRVDLTSGIVTTLRTKIPLGGISGIAISSSGDLIITEFACVRRIRLKDGAVSMIAGTGKVGFSGDGGPAIRAELRMVHSIVVDNGGNLYIVDYGNSRIRRVDARTGTITTVAGNGERNSNGDGGPAVAAGLEYPDSVAVDRQGNLFITQHGDGPESHRIRRVEAKTGIIRTLSVFEGAGIIADGRPVNPASLVAPTGLLLDRSGNIFIIEPANGRVQRIDAGKSTITTIAGTTKGFGGDGGPAREAQLNNPHAMAMDIVGNLYIAEYVGNRVRRVDARTGIIETVAGNGLPKRVEWRM
jgi:sugar lactone lactonase YvrE